MGDWEPVPARLEELWERESGWASGTHSVLDMREGIGLGPAERSDYQVRALDPAGVKALFGTALPSRADFEALARDDGAPRYTEFWGAVPMRWTGLYVYAWYVPPVVYMPGTARSGITPVRMEE